MKTAEQLLQAQESEHMLGARWANSPFAWVKRILPTDKGRVGENIVEGLSTGAGISMDGKNGHGHDRTLGTKRIEIKTGTLYDAADPEVNIVRWLQIRPDDDYAAVALVCICPDHVHVWLVDKDTVLAHAEGQHGGKKAEETKQVEANPDNAPEWMGPDVSVGGDAFAARFAVVTK